MRNLCYIIIVCVKFLFIYVYTYCGPGREVWMLLVLFSRYAMCRLSKTMLSLSKILIVSPSYMIMTVLTMVYGAVAIASDCAKFTLEVPHYFLL